MQNKFASQTQDDVPEYDLAIKSGQMHKPFAIIAITFAAQKVPGYDRKTVYPRKAEILDQPSGSEYRFALTLFQQTEVLIIQVQNRYHHHGRDPVKIQPAIAILKLGTAHKILFCAEIFIQKSILCDHDRHFVPIVEFDFDQPVARLAAHSKLIGLLKAFFVKVKHLGAALAVDREHTGNRSNGAFFAFHPAIVQFFWRKGEHIVADSLTAFGRAAFGNIYGVIVVNQPVTQSGTMSSSAMNCFATVGRSE